MNMNSKTFLVLFMLSGKASETFGDKLIPWKINYGCHTIEIQSRHCVLKTPIGNAFRRELSCQHVLRFSILNTSLAHAQISLTFLRAVKGTIS